MEASPNGYRATIEGILRHSQLLFHRQDRNLRLFAFYWLMSPFNIGFVIVFAVCLFYWAHYLKESLQRTEAIKKWIVAMLHIAIATGIFSFVLHAAPTVYNLTQFLYAIVLFTFVRHLRAGHMKSSRLLLGSLTVPFIAGSLLFLRTLFLFADNEIAGGGYDAARENLAKAKKIRTMHNPG